MVARKKCHERCEVNIQHTDERLFLQSAFDRLRGEIFFALFFGLEHRIETEMFVCAANICQLDPVVRREGREEWICPSTEANCSGRRSEKTKVRLQRKSRSSFFYLEGRRRGRRGRMSRVFVSGRRWDDPAACHH